MKLEVVVTSREWLYDIQRCPICGQRMRLIGIEPHPTAAALDMFSFECSCGEDVVTTVQRH